VSLLDIPKPPKKIEGARVIRKLNIDQDEPVCRSFPKTSEKDQRGKSRRIFSDEQVRDIRARFAKFMRLTEMVPKKYPGGTRRMKDRRARVRGYIYERYGTESIARMYGCSKAAIYAVWTRLSYGDVD